MPITRHDPHLDLINWENDDHTQNLTIGHPDPYETGWETARDNHWTSWLDVSGHVFGLTAEHTRNLAVLLQCGNDDVERTAAIPAAGPHTHLVLHVDTGLGHVTLRVTNSDTGATSRADIPATDCPPISELLVLLSQSH